MLEDGHLWGTLSVFDTKKREWTAGRPARPGHAGQPGRRGGAQRRALRQQPAQHLGAQEPPGGAAGGDLDAGPEPGAAAGAGRRGQGLVRADRLPRARRRRAGWSSRAGFGTDSKTAEKLALGLGGDICKRGDGIGPAVHGGHASRRRAADSPLNPRAVLCVPITLRGKPLGVLFLANYQVGHAVHRRPPQPRHRAGGAGRGRHRQRAAVQGPRGGHPLSPSKLSPTPSTRATPTRPGTRERVTQYALMIARQMKYSPNDQGAWVRLERGVPPARHRQDRRARTRCCRSPAS